MIGAFKGTAGSFWIGQPRHLTGTLRLTWVINYRFGLLFMSGGLRVLDDPGLSSLDLTSTTSTRATAWRGETSLIMTKDALSFAI